MSGFDEETIMTAASTADRTTPIDPAQDLTRDDDPACETVKRLMKHWRRPSMTPHVSRQVRATTRAIRTMGTGTSSTMTTALPRAVALVATAVLLVGLSTATASAAIVHNFLYSIPAPAGSWTPFGLAEDNSGSTSAGDVYATDDNHNVIDKFSSSGSYLCQITGAGSASASASECDAVNGVTGDSGAPGGFSGLRAENAVDSSGDLYVADSSGGVIDEFSPSGEFLTQLHIPGGDQSYAIALDAAGDLFVADASAGAVDEYNPTPPGSWTTFASGATVPGGLGFPVGIAVDTDPSSAGYRDVYVSDFTHAAVDLFGPTGAFLWQLTGTPSGGPFQTGSGNRVAVDPASGDLYVNDNSYVDEFAPSAAGPPTLLTRIQLPNNGAGFSVAVGGPTGQVDVGAFGSSGGSGSVVDVFGPGAIVPDVTTSAASNLEATGATLNGHVDPAGGGSVTGCRFEYVDQADYNPSSSDPYSAGQTESCSPSPPYATASDVSAGITGLIPSTMYHYRLDAVNANGTNYSQDSTFTTAGPPTIDAQTAVGDAHDATLAGQINPFGLDTTCKVQYVSDADYQRSGYTNATTLPCNPQDVGSAFGDQSASATLTGLQTDSTYDYRFIATNRSAPDGVDGTDQTLTTWGVSQFSFATTDQNGNPYTQAGGHPYQLTTTIVLNTNPGPAQNPNTLGTDGTLKDVLLHLPAGLVGNPTATPQCSDYDMSQFDCNPDSEVGSLSIDSNSGPLYQHVPIFNVKPPPGVPAEFAAAISASADAYITAGVRTGNDYGIDADSLNITGLASLTKVSVTMWGVPADASHNSQRECPYPAGGGSLSYQPPPCLSSSPAVPFLTMPTSCSGPLTGALQVDSYQDPGDYVSATSAMPAMTGCDALDFTPSLTVQPDTSSADSPSGLNVDLSVPQNQNPTGLAEADLQNASVTLPAGVSVDPSAAAGLTACSPAEIGMSNGNAPSCPDASKVGTVEVDTPLLADPLEGGIYVAQQNQNPFNSLLAIYVTAYADGVWVKLAGHVVPNPVTGQLTTTFDNNPQLPFTDFKLDFFGGSHGILATPQQCGTYTTTSDLSSYAGGPDATPSDSFTINSGCVNGFAPTFTAGTTNPQAGAFSPFVLSLTRADTDQSLSGLSVRLPDGMLAKLKGVAECSEADLAVAAAATGAQEQANPSCPASSQVGTVEAGAGVGPDPYFLSGKVYLTGPYKGGPYGLAVVVPAVAGPYDLGTVVVRQALDINPTTAQVTDVSDPFPTILQGIPMDIRRIDVDLNRPGFTVNPTSCTPSSVNGTVTSTGGATAKVSTRFQVGGCSSLAFTPKLNIGLSGKGQTKSGDHPTLTATLTQGRGQANIRAAKVTLPLSMALDPNNSQHVCSYATAAAVHGGAVGCATKTIVGTATADTPLLSKPLTGKVYLVQGLRCAKGSISAQGTCANGKTAIHTLPTLLVPLRGQIALDLRAKSSVNGAGALVTTFSTIPDAPVSKFTLQVTGGKKGLLVVTGRGQSICNKPQVASESLGAQSGKSMVNNDTLTTPCSKPRGKGRQHGR